MRLAPLALSLGLAAGAASAQAPAASPRTVVLVHGILNRPFVMSRIEASLKKAGYRTVDWGYETTTKSIGEYSRDLHAFVEKLDGPVDFVGFSLGSIILRDCLANHPPKNAGRFVQIAPPNQGSPLINSLYEFKAFRWVYGDKAIGELKAGSDYLKNLGAPRIPFGIIAGGLNNGKGFNPAIEGDDDGSVPVENTKLAGAADFVLIPQEHTLLLVHDQTRRQVLAFLKDGKFSQEAHP